jgi:hypothetical protein
MLPTKLNFPAIQEYSALQTSGELSLSQRSSKPLLTVGNRRGSFVPGLEESAF